MDSIELVGMPCPFIALLSKNNGEFALVTEFTSQFVVVSNDHWEDQRLTYKEFDSVYSGTVLLAEADSGSGEIDYEKKLLNQRIDNLRLPAIILTFLMIFAGHLYNDPLLSADTWLLLLVKTIGLIVSTLLLLQHIDSESPFVQHLCTKGKKLDCNAILSSEASKVNAYLSWSELGFFYFSGTWLALCYYHSSTSLLPLLAIVNLFTLPYTFYSIYYQLQIAKKWCVLCCVIQVLFWLEFSILVHTSNYNLGSISWSGLNNFLTLLAIPVAAWCFLKPFFVKALALAPVQTQLNQLKYNPEHFWSLLAQQPKYTLLPEENAVMLGNVEAEYTITMVANLNCSPCAKTHQILEKWQKETDRFKFQIIFSTADSENDPRAKVAEHIMALFLQNNMDLMLNALTAWYNRIYPNYDSWSKNYPVPLTYISAELVNQQRQWCKLAAIEVTPTLFVNGQKVPQTFSTEDLKHFI